MRLKRKAKAFTVILALLGSASLFANNSDFRAASSNPPEKIQPNLKSFFELQPKKDWLGASGGTLTVTNAGNMRFLQAFFYSDAGCSTVLGGASVIDNSPYARAC